MLTPTGPALVSGGPERAAGSPLRIASLAKQIPVAESMRLEDGRLVRDGLDLEMNAYCRRAVAAWRHARPRDRRLVHRADPRAAQRRGRPARGDRLGGRWRAPRLRRGLRRFGHPGHGPGAGGRAGTRAAPTTSCWSVATRSTARRARSVRNWPSSSACPSPAA